MIEADAVLMWRAGEPVSAAKLNRMIDESVGEIVVGPGLTVARCGREVIIGMEQVVPTRETLIASTGTADATYAGLYNLSNVLYATALSAGVPNLTDPTSESGTSNLYEINGLKGFTANAGGPARAFCFASFQDPGTGETYYLFDAGVGANPNSGYGSRQSVGHTASAAAAQTDTWDRGAQPASKCGMNLTVMSRTFYDSSVSPPKLYGYTRVWEFDQLGHLVAVSAETRVTILTPEIC